jgi:hypothetical protein
VMLNVSGLWPYRGRALVTASQAGRRSAATLAWLGPGVNPLGGANGSWMGRVQTSLSTSATKPKAENAAPKMLRQKILQKNCNATWSAFRGESDTSGVRLKRPRRLSGLGDAAES